ncbi:hypothetical protein BIW11_11307, partial [Tropilaelaps mercedesae]
VDPSAVVNLNVRLANGKPEVFWKAPKTARRPLNGFQLTIRNLDSMDYDIKITFRTVYETSYIFKGTSGGERFDRHRFTMVACGTDCDDSKIRTSTANRSIVYEAPSDDFDQKPGEQYGSNNVDWIPLTILSVGGVGFLIGSVYCVLFMEHRWCRDIVVHTHLPHEADTRCQPLAQSLVLVVN